MNDSAENRAASEDSGPGRALARLRAERKLGDSVASTGYANQLRRRFPGSKEYQELQKGRFD